MNTESRREPAGFASPPDRHRQKWEDIVSAFMAGDWDKLRSLQRSGARGRIFATLVRQCFNALAISYECEPLFPHVSPRPWYAGFAAKHELKLAAHEFYNPDFLLNDGTWVEATLSENTAFKKLFRYGHQAPGLLVLWLDADDGLHTQVCKEVEFPNADVRPVDWYYPQLDRTADGRYLVDKLQILKRLKHQVL